MTSLNAESSVDLYYVLLTVGSHTERIVAVLPNLNDDVRVCLQPTQTRCKFIKLPVSTMLALTHLVPASDVFVDVELVDGFGWVELCVEYGEADDSDHCEQKVLHDSRLKFVKQTAFFSKVRECLIFESIPNLLLFYITRDTFPSCVSGKYRMIIIMSPRSRSFVFECTRVHSELCTVSYII